MFEGVTLARILTELKLKVSPEILSGLLLAPKTTLRDSTDPHLTHADIL